jgi:hypothetical protein
MKHTIRVVCLAVAPVLTGLAAALGANQPTPKSADQQKSPVNLVPNGDFEKGDLTPTGWQTVDGLTSFWVHDSDPAHGRVLKFDTDVLQQQAYHWWVQIAKGASPKDAPKKIPSKDPNKYDTLAAFDGAFMWSDFIPIEKDKAYWLALDVKGQAGMMVWLVGYPEKTSTAFGADMAAFQEYLKEKVAGKPDPKKRNFDPFIHKYVWKGQLTVGGSNEWKTYSRREKPFRPTANTPNVRYVRVLLLPYWPPGTYCVDNVKLVEYSDAKK